MGARSVQIIDEDRTVAKVDKLSKGLIISSIIENSLHEGKIFIATLVEKSLMNGSSIEILIQTGSPISHGGFRIETSGVMDFDVFEAPTITDTGTPLALIARHRVLLGNLELTTFSAPTITVDGLLLFSEILPQAGERLLGGLFADELIMAPNTKYLLRFSNTSGGNINIGIAVDLFEEASS